MKKLFLAFCVSLGLSAPALLMAGAGDAWAGGHKGTAAEAKAMLTRAVAAMKANKRKALADFSAGRKGFKDRDLFVFCARLSDRIMIAHGGYSPMVGVKISKLVTKKGRRFGDEILDMYRSGKIKVIKYETRNWNTKKRATRETFFTKVAGHACAVGYFP